MSNAHENGQVPAESEADTLMATKQRISQKYLGQAGIHAIGLQKTRNAISVYYHPKSGSDQDAILKTIRAEAHPYALITIPEAPAALNPTPTQNEDKRGAV